MELKPGYKMTDAGLIPSDWVDYTVGDLIAFEGGSQPDKSHFKQSWNPGYVRLIQIRDYKSNKYETYVPSKLVRRFCDENDIMIGRYGPPVFQILKGISGAYNVALIKATPTSQLNKKYAYYFLKQDSLFTFVDKLSQRSSGQTGVDLKELKAYPLSLPSTKIEQEAIAEALSDADSLIESLEQVIAKKCQIKQGAMQELLTGKRRLPGFSGKWEVKSLREIASVNKGRQLPCNEIGEMGKFIYLNGGISASGYSEKWNALAATIAISEGGNSCGFVQFMREPFWCGGHCYSVMPSTVDNLFLYHALKFEQPSLMSLRVGSGLPNIQKNALLGFKIILPINRDEQEAIATLLGDMDTELDALESRLAKARQIKQGMMQELLTGRIRLL